MALSILKPIGQKNGMFQFKADIGTNTFYQYEIGQGKKKYKGIDQIALVRFRSPILSRNHPLQKIAASSFVLEIPEQHFDREKDKVQLISFKNQDGSGLAVSEVINIFPSLRSDHPPLFPSFNLSVENIAMESTSVKHKPFNYQESKLSKPMFWGALISAIPAVIGAAAPLVKKLFSKKKKTSPTAPASATTEKPGSSTKDEILGAIIDMLGNIKGNNSAPQAEAPAPSNPQPAAQSLSVGKFIDPATLIELIPFFEQVISRETLLAIGDDPLKLFKAIGEAALKMTDQEAASVMLRKDSDTRASRKPDKYAEAQFLSKLIGAIPGVPPIVKAAIAPHTLLGYASPSQQILKSLMGLGNNNGALDNLNLGINGTNHTMNDDDLAGLLASMSMSSASVPAIPFKVKTNVKLQFVATNTVELHGKKRLLYSKNSDLHFPIKITTDHPNAPQNAIPKVIVQAVFHDAETDQFLLEKKFRLKDIQLEETISNIVISKDEAIALPNDKDIKLNLSFIWKGKKTKENCGVFKIHYFRVVSDYLFNRIGSAVETPIPLNDVVSFRPFWHKVWEGGFSESKRWEVSLAVKYYYTVDLREDTISKLSTKRKIETDNAGGERSSNRRKVAGKIKSGMELSLHALNQLLVSRSKSPLNEAQLEAIRTDYLKKSYTQVARTQVELRGRAGDTATLWTYPEISIHQVYLARPNTVNELGQVTELTEEVVEFPRPSSIHFIGTKSE